MKKFWINLFLITLLTSITFIAIQTSRGEEGNKVVMIYNSWSVVSRNLRPVVAEVAAKNNYPLLELDIDNPNIHNELLKMKITAPAETPSVAIIKNGSVVFQKDYPDSNPALLKADLSKVLGQ